MPIKMIYQPTENDTPVEVDVYNFQYLFDESLTFIALCWVAELGHWISVPIFTLKPITKKQTLNE